MNDFQDRLKDGMAEATRLTRAGRLREATSVIQRTLGLGSQTVESDARRGSTADPMEPFEASYRLVEKDTPSEKASPADTDTSIQEAAFHSAKAVQRVESARDGAAAAPGNPSPRAWERLKSLGKTLLRELKTSQEETPSSPQAKGKFIDGTFTNAAGTRTYKLYIPSSYVGQALPLIVMLHGCTQSSADFANGTRMNDLAEKEGFFVLYPEQLKAANHSKCWNWFQSDHQSRDAGEPGLIAGITRKIMSTYNVDASRVYIGGMSAGGAMAAIMAATYPDIYAAVGVHSGLPYGAAHDLRTGFEAMKKGPRNSKQRLTRVIPLIMFHGDNDTTVSKVNAAHIRDQWLQGAANGNGSPGNATTERGRAVGGHAYTRSTYHDHNGRAILEEWIIHHGGHAWSGGSSRGSYTDPQGPDASAEMARFFNKYSMGN